MGPEQKHNPFQKTPAVELNTDIGGMTKEASAWICKDESLSAC